MIKISVFHHSLGTIVSPQLFTFMCLEKFGSPRYVAVTTNISLLELFLLNFLFSAFNI
jgi:hypothetical protein